MKYAQISQDQWFLRLEKDEELITQLREFAKKYNFSSGFVQGIGGLQAVTLGLYRLSSSKDYEFTDFAGDLELTSLTGNLSVVDSNPLWHIHAVVGDEQLQTVGGHLRSAIVAGTVELYVTRFANMFTRRLDKSVGLQLLEFESPLGHEE